MHLAQLKVSNFRKLKDLTLQFQPGLNVIVGANNSGKTAVIDALRALLAVQDEPYPGFDLDDIHRPNGGLSSGDIEFHFVFRGLSVEEEADFIAALLPTANGQHEAHFGVRYSPSDKAGRLRVKRWCGKHEDVPITSDMIENLRGVYMPPLRDASLGLRPSRNSKLARLFQILSDDAGRKNIDAALLAADAALRKEPPVQNTHDAIAGRHRAMLGSQLAQSLDLGISGSDFQRLASRLSLSVDLFDIEQNGLGFNNLIYMAVVLSELSKNPDARYRGLIVEEPEAHLHPQLQAVLLAYLMSVNQQEGQTPVQVFVTSHSPSFASRADIDSVICLYEHQGNAEVLAPRLVAITDDKKNKLQRYLDVTRAELLFAKRIIFVEGIAELLLVAALAEQLGIRLREYGVSLISVEGLNFDSFLPLFGTEAMKIKVAVLTDADPPVPADDGEEPQSHYPAIDAAVVESPSVLAMRKHEDDFVKVCCGKKTFEYDLALFAKNRPVMLEALRELHPQIAKKLEAQVDAASTDAEKARVLYRGMFERTSGSVQKGRFAQSLAQKLADGRAFEVPSYVREAIMHVTTPELPTA